MTSATKNPFVKALFFFHPQSSYFYQHQQRRVEGWCDTVNRTDRFELYTILLLQTNCGDKKFECKECGGDGITYYSATSSWRHEKQMVQDIIPSGR